MVENGKDTDQHAHNDVEQDAHFDMHATPMSTGWDFHSSVTTEADQVITRGPALMAITTRVTMTNVAITEVTTRTTTTGTKITITTATTTMIITTTMTIIITTTRTMVGYSCNLYHQPCPILTFRLRSRP
ncbi:hypothetical protein PBRA_001970 [Plasmodiophora brassicae]|uniref:Uncharacterized protein n=1 Tax=Plasmodiophora brassicae TaxID=37360 RepID=A0A0G4J1Z0_PLABS|nr:hypothetical protein PBRA_001970 [Plasmodiophora brassicae]